MIDETNPFAAAKPDRRLIKLLIQARRFNTALVGSDGTPFAALAKREGVSPSYFTRLLFLSILPPKKRGFPRRGAGISTRCAWSCATCCGHSTTSRSR